MGIAAISATGMAGFLLAPLQALVGFFAPWQTAGARASNQCQTTARASALPGKASDLGTMARAPALNGMLLQPRPATRTPAQAQVSRLRVIRVMDAGSPPQTAGRMLISGRMADVCAELDRMAHREAVAASRAH